MIVAHHRASAVNSGNLIIAADGETLLNNWTLSRTDVVELFNDSMATPG